MPIFHFNSKRAGTYAILRFTRKISIPIQVLLNWGYEKGFAIDSSHRHSETITLLFNLFHMFGNSYAYSLRHRPMLWGW